MRTVIDFLKKHPVLTNLGSAVLGAAGLLATIETARIDRYEGVLLTEYVKINDAKASIYTNTEKFTYKVAEDNKPDGALADQISASLIQMDQSVAMIASKISGPESDRVESLRTAIVNFKTELRKVNSVDDLQYLTTTILDFERAYGNVQGVLESKFGRPTIS